MQFCICLRQEIVFLIYLCHIKLKYSVILGVAVMIQDHWTEASAMYRAIRTQIWAQCDDFCANENFRSYNKVMLTHATVSDMQSRNITSNAYWMLFWFTSRRFLLYKCIVHELLNIGKKKKVCWHLLVCAVTYSIRHLFNFLLFKYVKSQNTQSQIVPLKVSFPDKESFTWRNENFAFW